MLTPPHETQHHLHRMIPFHIWFRGATGKKKRKMREANYSLTAGWSETNLIIIIVKKAQRKPAAFLRFHHNPIERLLAFVMIYKVTSQTDLLWQPERDPHEHYYCSCDQISSPSPVPLFLCYLSSTLPPIPKDSEEWGWLNRGRQQAYWIPPTPLAQHEPPSNEREKLCLVEVAYLKRQSPQIRIWSRRSCGTD